MSEQVGSIHYDVELNIEKLKGSLKDIDQKLDGLKKSNEKTSASFTKMGIVAGAVAGVVSNVFNRAINLVTDSIGSAIKRVDTLNNSSRTFDNMGFKAKDTKKAMDNLDKSIRGLPTSLDGAVRNVSLLAASTNDIKKSQSIFAAMNDAILGFGGNTAMVDNAITQLSQDLAGGRITAQTWLSLLNSGLGPALNAMARDMGITTKELKAGLSDGSISVDKFTKSLIKLDQKGGGGMKSFRKIALDSTAGISTGFANMQTAIARGVATIITAIGSKNISDSIGAIGKAFESVLKAIASTKDKVIEIANAVSKYLSPKLTQLWNSLEKNIIPLLTQLWKDILEPMIPVIGTTLVVAIGAVIDAVKILSDTIGWWIKELKQGNIWLHFVTDALIALGAAMMLNKAFAALTAGFNLLTTSTIPRVITKMTALKLLVRTPMVMPAIAIGAALIAIQQVMDAHSRMQQAIKGAKTARENLLDITKKTNRHFLDVYYNFNSTKEQKEKAKIFLHRAGVKGFANGVRDFSGGWAVVGERGPELLNLPKGSNVFSNEESKSMGASVRIGAIYDKSDADYIFRRIDTNQRHLSRGVAPA